MPVESDDELSGILQGERIAVVGASRHPHKDAHRIPRYLVEHGYEVLPVNPNATEVLGRPAADHLGGLEGPLDIVDVFRPSDEVAGIVDAAIERGDVGTIWL
ncbi:MAG: CoA-binding protein, partial [Halobacteriota archaeon]